MWSAIGVFAVVAAIAYVLWTYVIKPSRKDGSGPGGIGGGGPNNAPKAQ